MKMLYVYFHTRHVDTPDEIELSLNPQTQDHLKPIKLLYVTKNLLERSCLPLLRPCHQKTLG